MIINLKLISDKQMFSFIARSGRATALGGARERRSNLKVRNVSGFEIASSSLRLSARLEAARLLAMTEERNFSKLANPLTYSLVNLLLLQCCFTARNFGDFPGDAGLARLIKHQSQIVDHIGSRAGSVFHSHHSGRMFGSG